jgi:hypothetical protein
MTKALVRCPGCDDPLALPAGSCPRCGLRLAGWDAYRLWEVDEALRALGAERRQLLTELRRHEATPAPAVGATLPPSSPWAPPVTRYAAGRREATPLAPQQLLLVLGAGLLLVSAIVFAAVAWHSLGLFVQSSAMVIVTVVAIGIASTSANRGLRATAEATGVVASGLVGIDLWAAHRFGVLGLEAVSPRTFGCAGSAVAVIVLGACAVLIDRVRAFAVVAVLAGQVAVLSLPVPAAGVAIAALLLALSIGDRFASGFLPGHLAVAARWCAAAAWSAGTVLALISGLAGVSLTGRPSGWLAAGLAAAAAVSVAPPFQRDLTPSWRVPATAGAAVIVVMDTAVAGALAGGVAAWCVIAVLGAVLAASGPRLRGAARSRAVGVGLGVLGLNGLATLTSSGRPMWWIPAAAGGVAAIVIGRQQPGRRAAAYPAGALALIAGLSGGLHAAHDGVDLVTTGALATSFVVVAVAARHPDAAAAPGLLAVAAGAGFVAMAAEAGPGRAWVLSAQLGAAGVVSLAASLRRRWAALTVPIAAGLLTAGCGAGFGAAHVSAGAAGFVVAALGAAWLGCAVGWSAPPRLGLYVVAAASAVAGMAAAAGRPGWLALACTVGGASCLTGAGRPDHGWLGVPGVALLAAALWDWLGANGVRLVEAYSLPLAALLLLIGAVQLARDPQASSWIVAGPAVVVGLVPSALVATTDAQPLRTVLVLVAAAGIVIAGLVMRWRAAVIPASMCLGMVVVAQLAPYAVGAPRWLTLGTLGLILLSLGARYERRMHDVRLLRSWLAGLH